jgi:pSer/pThr/pTyr-binding forkhead associated (FHA) protein
MPGTDPASTAAPQQERPADARRDLLVRFKAGQVIFTEGQRGGEMFIIEDGQVEIVRRRGAEDRSLVLLEAGDFFGEMALLEDLPRSATARAVSDCRLLPIDASTFDLMLRDHPEVAIRIMRMLSRRLRQFDEAEQRANAIAAGPLRGLSHTSMEPAAVVARPAIPQTPPTPQITPTPQHPPTPPNTADPAGARRARLVHRASGSEFGLAADGEQVVGRLDPVTGLVPEIDLTPLDSHRSLSRRHARIVARAGHFFLREEIGTANGTFIGAVRLATGREQELHDGETVRLGLVELDFHLSPPVSQLPANDPIAPPPPPPRSSGKA